MGNTSESIIILSHKVCSIYIWTNKSRHLIWKYWNRRRCCLRFLSWLCWGKLRIRLLYRNWLSWCGSLMRRVMKEGNLKVWTDFKSIKKETSEGIRVKSLKSFSEHWISCELKHIFFQTQPLTSLYRLYKWLQSKMAQCNQAPCCCYGPLNLIESRAWRQRKREISTISEIVHFKSKKRNALIANHAL